MNQNDRDFWNLRYLDGGNSGKGSIGLNKMWKWSKIRKTLSDSVLDYGCGDLSFWKGITKFETGLMVSVLDVGPKNCVLPAGKVQTKRCCRD